MDATSVFYSTILLAIAFFLFFFNDTATTEIYTLSLHDALPICRTRWRRTPWRSAPAAPCRPCRSEEHTSELQSPDHLVCRLLLEKKKKKITASTDTIQVHSDHHSRRAPRLHTTRRAVSQYHSLD